MYYHNSMGEIVYQYIRDVDSLQLGGTNRVELRFCGDWVDTRWTLGGQTKVVKLARGGSVFKGAPPSSFIIKDKYKPMGRTTISCIRPSYLWYDCETNILRF